MQGVFTMKNIIIYLICINIIGFFIMWLDKHKARRNQWRIPEKVLLGIAFVGGAFGALSGMRVFHHKTKHVQFVIGVPVACVLWVVILSYVLFNWL